jgi:carbon monoxide dehydrogenase subunit G
LTERAVQLKYSGQEHVRAGIENVWSFLNSPNDIIGCLPDVLSSEIIDATHIHAIVNVSVGAIGGHVDFAIELEPKRENSTVVVKLRGSGIGSSIDLVATAALIPRRDSTTTLDWAGVATIFGMLATAGGRVMEAQGQRIFTHVFSRIGERLGAIG